MKPQLVLIEWEDISSDEGGWTSTEAVEAHTVAKCQSVGWLVKNGKTHITIAASRSLVEGDTEPYSGLTSIPKGCIKRRVKL